MCIEGEDIVFDLILTKSGHYVLPLDTFKENMVKRAEHKSGNERLLLFNNQEIEDQKIEEIYETDWNHTEEDKLICKTTIIKRHRKDGSTPQYLQVDREKIKQLEKLTLSHKVKPAYRRNAIAKNNPETRLGDTL